MKPRLVFAFSSAMAVLLLLAMASGCNITAQKGQGQPQPGSEYASQSEALRGDSGGNLAGTQRLEYDHHFQFEQSGTKVDIAITGEIPLYPTSASTMVFECSESRKSETEVLVVYQLAGNGKVKMSGTADWMEDSSGCLCSLDDTIEVTIQGVEYPVWQKPQSGGGCQWYATALKVMETWNTAPAWQCTCKTPEKVEKMHLEENLAMFSSWGNPELEKKTMIFTWCPGDSDLVENLVFGRGDYWWRYHSGQNEGSNRYSLGLSFADWKPGDLTDPITCPPGEWGPPLESITAENPVPKWEPMQQPP